MPAPAVIRCPITGEEVKIVEVAHGEFSVPGFMGVVAAPYGGYSTRIFTKRSLLEDFFRYRNGVLKGKPATAKIEVVGVKQPPSMAEAAEAQEKQVERDSNEVAQAGVERIVRGLR